MPVLPVEFFYICGFCTHSGLAILEKYAMIAVFANVA